MKNRRNYYRILQIQPDAPQALIRASYRTLMQKLRYHPDLGGDHWNATLVNEAYRVLSDPDTRRKYDQSLGDRLFDLQRRPGDDPRGTPAPANNHGKPEKAADGLVCPFCQTPNPAADRGNRLFCEECRSPLQAVDIDKFFPPHRRAVGRVELHGNVQYYTAWPQNPHIGRLRNVSPGGLAMSVKQRLRGDEIIKIEAILLSAIGQVVHSRRNPFTGTHDIGVKLLTASFNCRHGTFLNIEI